jgi:hypothetical protein
VGGAHQIGVEEVVSIGIWHQRTWCRWRRPDQGQGGGSRMRRPMGYGGVTPDEIQH